MVFVCSGRQFRFYGEHRRRMEADDYDGDGVTDSYSYRHGYTNRDPYPDADCYSDGYPNANCDSDRYPNTDCDSDGYPNANCDSDGYTDANAARLSKHIRRCPLLLESSSWPSFKCNAQLDR